MADKNKRQQNLSEAIQQFAATPRYNFLRCLQVGRFLDDVDAGIGVVSELTFEKLVELGSTKLTKLRWLTKDQEGRLIQLLQVLADEPGASPMEGLISPPKRPSALSPHYSVNEDEGLSSAEVENRLRSILTDLAAHPKFSTISHKSLGSYWSSEWPRAPFEEAMSLEQLCEMDLAQLWKKRMTTSRRIDRMARAAQEALTTLMQSVSSPTPSGPETLPVHTPIKEHRRLSVVAETGKVSLRSTVEHAAMRHAWMQDLHDIQPLEAAGIQRFIEACLRPDSRADVSGLLVATLLDTLTRDDFLEIIAPGWKISDANPRVILWKAIPEVKEWSLPIRLALQGLGIHLSQLRLLLPALSHDEVVAELAVTAIAKMLGATEVMIKGEVCQKVYTLNPGLLAVALAGITDFDPTDPASTLSAAIPCMDSRLFDWVLKRLATETPSPPRKRGKKTPN